MTLALLGVALVAGRALQPHVQGRFPLLFRGHLLLVSLPLALLGGWSFRPRLAELTAIGLLLVAELAGLGLGGLFARTSHARRFVAAGAQSNTSFWSIPVTVALFGPAAAAFPILFENLLAPIRSTLAVWLLRSSAPAPPGPGTAGIDYARPVALLLGFALQLALGAPAGWVGPAIAVLAALTGVVGFALLGLALPPRVPAAAWTTALRTLPPRFGPGVAVLGMAAWLGAGIPDGAWVVALAPTWFAYLSWSTLFGHSREHAAAVIGLTVAAAVLLLPAVRWLAAVS